MTETRVLWLVKGLGPGGAERLLVTHAHFADRSRYSYDVVYLVPGKNQLVGELAAESVPAECLGSGRSWDLRWAWRLRRRLAADPVEVVHSHSPMPAAVVRVLARTLPRSQRPRLVYTEHNEWGKHRRLTRWANRLTMPLEGSVIAVSDGVKRSMRTRRRDDVLVVRHGVDVDGVRAQADRAAVRDELGIADELVVGTVANLRWEKGYDVLLDAAAEIVRTWPDVRFVAVGQGPLEDELQARHERLGLGARFLFLGYRADAVRVMSGFDLFCLASRHEGLPVALMEAIALGLPVAVPDVGGISEIVDPDQLIEASVAGLVEAVGRFRAHPTPIVATDISATASVRTIEDCYSGHTAGLGS
ncbi:MAG: glycosyltransferase [Acidimicrobiia bacterium]|nr:glycosyltransferase [Acidimicrobiia bacterium]